MPIAVVYSRANVGVDARAVTVEADVSNGLPSFSIVGLPETVVKESKDRVRSALRNSQFEFPAKRITINLAPADLPKEGGRFDLPIALSILAATQQIATEELMQYEFAGELALSGALRPIHGCLPSALAVAKDKRHWVIPRNNAEEACLAEDLSVLAADHLLDVCGHLNGTQRMPSQASSAPTDTANYAMDMQQVVGQDVAKRALEIAAAGGHNVLMSGPPGAGKSLLAGCLPSILPPMTREEALSLAAIRSVAGQSFDPDKGLVRPFRAPHHSASAAALVGGGRLPQPGEVSLAHHGILFLDELPEFSRRVLEMLREPLSTGQVTIARVGGRADFPASCQLVAAMNPCPCGYYSENMARCRCTLEQVRAYQQRLSGPLMDRIDLHISMQAVPPALLYQTSTAAESSATIRSRVVACRARQLSRQAMPNARLPASELAAHCQLSEPDQAYLCHIMERLQLSARAYHRLLRVARTVADLAERVEVVRSDLQEAVAFCRRFNK